MLATSDAHGGPRRVGATKTHLRAGDESDETLSCGEERCEGTYTRGGLKTVDYTPFRVVTAAPAGP